MSTKTPAPAPTAAPPPAEKGKEGATAGEKGKEGEAPGAPPPAGATPDAAASSSDKDANGKCIGHADCPAPPVNFSAPQQGIDSMKKKLDEGVKNAGKNIVIAMTNPAKCAANVVGAVPTIFSGIFKAISDGLDRIAESFNGVTTAAADQGFDGILAIPKIGHAKFMTGLNDILEKAFLEPGFLSKPEFEGMTKDQISDEMIKKALSKTEMFKDAYNTAEFRGIFKPWLKEIVDSLQNLIKIAQPDIDRLNADVKGIIEGMGDNVGDSLGNAVSGAITSAVAALPGVGSITSAIASIDEINKKFIEKCGPIAAKAGGIYVPAKMGFDKQVSRINCEVNRLSHKLDPLMKKIENATRISSQAGGMRSRTMRSRTMRSRTMRPHDIKKNIQKTTKRVNYLLKRFTCRQNHKTNYTRRLNASRC